MARSKSPTAPKTRKQASLKQARPPQESLSQASLFRRILVALRGYFLTGIIIAAPIGITIVVVDWFIELVDGWFLTFVPDAYQPAQWMPFSIPGLGILASVVFLILLGALTANFMGRALLTAGEQIIDRMPVVRSIYGALKQIFETALSRGGESFQEAGMIEYPRPGLYALVFFTSTSRGEVAAKIPKEPGDDIVGVFLPTTPNPTSGFLLFLPRSKITPLAMSVEEAARMVISAGLVEPNAALQPERK